MPTPFRWAVLGTGGIARGFALDLQRLPDAEIVAVGSRTAESAGAFAKQHGIPRPYASYAEAAGDPDVDAVYVAGPHPTHRDMAMLGIEAGKAVLVEKPFTLSAAQAGELVEAARARGTFLMEAMWTRFLPHAARVRELVAAGALGDVRRVIADLSQGFPYDPAHRLFAPELGGGALLDLGVYPVSFASMVLGRPERVTAVSDPTATGVDAQTVLVLQHAGGRQAVLAVSLEAVGPNRAAVVGTDARLELGHRWYAPGELTLTRRDGSVERYPDDTEGGLRFEAAEVARCVRAGRTESDLLPLAETLAVMETLDEARRQIGLRYPGEPA